MAFTRKNPLGNPDHLGSYYDSHDEEKYESIEQAYLANDFIIIDFVVATDGTEYLELRHTKSPKKCSYHNYDYAKFGESEKDEKQLELLIAKMHKVNKY